MPEPNAETKRAPSAGARFITILCLIAAPIAVYFAARNALVRLDPELIHSLPPVNQAVLFRRALRNSAHPEYKVTEQDLAYAQEAVRWEPLDFRPFFIAARAAEQGNDTARAIALLEESRRRRATWLPTRLLLAGAYYKANQREPMIRELDYSLRLNERVRIAVLPELVKLLRDAEGRRYVAEMLAANPSWKQDFFAFARGAKVAPAVAADLMRLAEARGGDASAERALYLSALVGAGQADAARAQWLQSLPAADRERSRLLFNGDFASTTAAGDFGWNLAALDVGRSDIVDSQGRKHLRVRYFGGSNAVLAQQLIALPPGTYRLEIAGRAESSPTLQQIVWEVVCQSGNTKPVRVPLARLAETGTVAATFSVPGQGCRSQHLRLFAEPGDVSSPSEVEISRIQITNVG